MDDDETKVFLDVYEKNIKTWKAWYSSSIKETEFRFVSPQHFEEWKNPQGKFTGPIQNLKDFVEQKFDLIVFSWAENITGLEIIQKEMKPCDTQLIRGPNKVNQKNLYGQFLSNVMYHVVSSSMYSNSNIEL